MRTRSRSRGATRPTGIPLSHIVNSFDTTIQINGVNQRTSLFTPGDLYTVDGVTGKVASIVDRYDAAHSAVQATDALQAVVPTADAVLRGNRSMTFNNAQYYVSNRAASAFRFLHAGPRWVVAVYVPTDTVAGQICATIPNAPALSDIGLLVRRSSVDVRVRSYNGVGLAVNAGISTTEANGTAYCTSSDYLEGASPEWRTRQNGAEVSTGASTLAPVDSDPGSTLVIGAASDFAAPLRARLAFLLMAPFQPTTAQRTLLNSYLTQVYGVSV